MRPFILNYGPWPHLQRFWDVRAACNFIGGGTGTGLLLIAAAASWTAADWTTPALVALACIGLGLMMVFLEIGRPWRSINVFFHPQTSWMTREGVLALPLFALGAAALGAAWFVDGRAGGLLLTLAALVGVGFLLCQVNILRAARGVPAWRHPALRPFMAMTGLAEGGGLYVALTALSGPTPWVLAAVLAVVALRAVAWRHYRASLRRDGAPEASLAVLDSVDGRFLALGHALPAGLLIAALALPGLGGAAVAAGLLVTGLGWYAKVMLVTRAAATRGFAVPHTPVRGRGTSRSADARPGWRRQRRRISGA